MSISYLRMSIVKSSSGKSAIAAAAYQSGNELHSERLGTNYHYSGKEEIVHEEILLPKNAPEKFLDRETLWNEVESVQNKSNSRFARQLVIAIPNEWSREESINYCRTYLQTSLVDRGMIVDWAYHEKNGENEDPDNHHVHALCTVRGINENGNWVSMEKKEYALDEEGNRIPIIDPKTGEQKVRVRERNGYTSEEKLWKRITVQSNNWNSREFLKQIKEEWAITANKHLSESNKIDMRSYKERQTELLPMLHEGSSVREMTKRGIDTEIHQENLNRQKYNDTLKSLQDTISKSKIQLDQAVNTILNLEARDGSALIRQTIYHGTGLGSNIRVPGNNKAIDGRESESEESIISEGKRQLNKLSNINHVEYDSSLPDDIQGNSHKRRHRM